MGLTEIIVSLRNGSGPGNPPGYNRRGFSAQFTRPDGFLLALLIESQWRLLRLTARAVWPPPEGSASRRPSRAVKMLVFGMLFWLYSLLQWAGLLLDELFFRGYRKVTVHEPWFVLGIPRSGTTFLHEVLSANEQITTFSTWECFAAPSISARYLITGLDRLDRRLHRPFGRLAARLGRRWFAALDDRHPVRLRAPEEDFYTLLPLGTCFALIAAFPDSEDLWRMSELDRARHQGFAKGQLRFYRAMLQRHLYFHGPDKRLLSKNASFAGLAFALREAFPDARFFVCLRPPEQTLSSQISTLEPALALFGSDDPSGRLRERFVQAFGFYYRNLLDFIAALPPECCAELFADELRSQLDVRLIGVLERFGQAPSPSFHRSIRAQALVARRAQSSHRHSLRAAGLEEPRINTDFADIIARLARLRAARPAPARP